MGGREAGEDAVVDGGAAFPMRPRDWTPAVLVTATVCVTVVGMVWILTPWLRGLTDPDPGPAHGRRLPPAEVAAWVGDLEPGLKAVLAPVWGDPGPDRFHDDEVNRILALAEGQALAYYRLIVFNTSAEERVMTLTDGAIAIRPSAAGDAVTFRSLASMVERGEVTLGGGTRSVLAGLGALSESVKIPAGSAVTLLVPFSLRVDLGEVAGVSTRDGAAFRRRPMARAELHDLLSDAPDEQRVKDL